MVPYFTVWVADSLVVQVMVAPVWVMLPAVRLEMVGGVVSWEALGSLVQSFTVSPFVGRGEVFSNETIVASEGKQELPTSPGAVEEVTLFDGVASPMVIYRLAI